MEKGRDVRHLSAYRLGPDTHIGQRRLGYRPVYFILCLTRGRPDVRRYA